jgi:hypothetical protein
LLFKHVKEFTKSDKVKIEYIKTILKRELLSLLLLDIAVVFLEVIAIFVAYAMWRFIPNETLAIMSVLLILIIFPTIFFIIGYRYLKLKNLLCINRRYIFHFGFKLKLRI